MRYTNNLRETCLNPVYLKVLRFSKGLQGLLLDIKIYDEEGNELDIDKI